VARRPLGSCPQGLSPLVFHLVVGHGCGFCWFLGERESGAAGQVREQSSSSLACSVSRGRRRCTMPYKMTLFSLCFLM